MINLYKFFPYFIAFMFFLIAIFMIANPKASTKAEFRNDANMVSKTRRNGIFMLVFGIIMLILGLVGQFFIK